MLRLGSCPLNLYLFRINSSDTPDCQVDEAIETVGHYLLHCTRYEQQREVLFGRIGQFFPADSSLEMSESVLLGGYGVDWPLYQHVADAVVAYVIQTRGIGFTGFQF